MRIQSKILLITIPLVLVAVLVSAGVTFFLSRSALTGLADNWLNARLEEAERSASLNEETLRRFGLENVATNVRQAQAETAGEFLTVDVGEQGYIYAVDGQGNLVAHPDAALIGSNLSAESWVQAILSGHHGEFSYNWLGEDQLGSHIYFEPWDWYIIATAPENEVYGLVNQAAIYMFVLSIVTVIILSAILVLFTRRLVAPLHELETGAQKIGQGDLDTQIVITSQDEIGTLAYTFNDMAAQLQAMLSGLEQRVADRTRDLALAAEIGRNIAQIRDLDELLSSSVERIRSRFDLYYTQIYLVDEDNDRLVLRAGTGLVGESLLGREHTLPLDTRSINGLAVVQNEPVIVADTATSPLFRPNPSLPYTRSEMAVPLVVGENVLGIIDLQSTITQGLNEDNLPAFEALAGQIAIAIENVALFKEQTRLTQILQENTKQLEENSIFLDSIIDNIPLILFVKNAKDLKMLRWNKMSTDYFGMTEAEIIGKTDYDTYPKEEADIYFAQDRKVLDEGVLVELPNEIRPTIHGERTLRSIKTPIFGADGSPQYLLGISQDITEQKEAERMLNERVKELNLLNDIGRKTDEQPPLEEFLTYIANRIPAGMQYTDLCRVAITLGDNVYGDPEAVNLPSQIVEGLRLDGERVGRIYIAYTEKRTFLNEESALVGSIGRRVTDYIANRRLLERVQATVGGLQTVAEVGTAIASQQDTQLLLQNVVDLTKTKFDFYHAHIYLYDETSDALVLSAGAGEIGRQMVSESRQIPLSAPQSLVARSARERRELIVANVKTDPSFLPHPLLPETRSEMAAPLVVGDRLIGVMDIQSSVENGFTPEDINIQTTLAAQIAVALQNVEQYEQTQAALDEVNALQRALTREGWQAYMTAVNRPTQGFQVSQNKIQPIHKEETDPTSDNGEKNRIAYPLSVRGTAIGQLGVNTEGKNLSDDDLALLESISEQVAEALERARLFEETELGRQEIEQQAAELTTVNEISDLVSTQLNLDNLLTAVGSHLEETFDTASVYISLFDTKSETFTFPYYHNKEEGHRVVAPRSLNDSGGFTGKIIQSRQPLLYNNPEGEASQENIIKLGANLIGQGRLVDSFLGVPMLIGDTVIGVIGLTAYRETRIYNESDQQLMSTLAGTIGVAIQNARQFEDTQRRANREALVNEISQKIQGAATIESALQTAVTELGKALNIRKATVELKTLVSGK